VPTRLAGGQLLTDYCRYPAIHRGFQSEDKSQDSKYEEGGTRVCLVKLND